MNPHNTNYEACANRLDFHEKVENFTMMMYGNPSIPRSEVQSIVEKVGDFISDAFTENVQKEINTVLGGTVDPEILGKIHAILENSKNPFKNFASEHLRFEQYKKDGLLFEPEEFEIGKDASGKSVKGAHISLIQTLKTFLELPGVYKSMKDYMKSVENEKDIIYNVTQGRLWRKKYKKDGRNAFPFFVSFDDMQPGNSLGSHANQQKLGMVYGSLPCLPPHLVSKLTNIFFITVFHSNDRVEFGNSAVFGKLKEDLNELSKQGLNICVDGINEIAYFDCLLLVGDNLGLNSCCGFSESFNSHYYCRICNAASKDCQTSTVEDESLLRTKKSYHSDLLNRTRGIKEECIFHDLPHFHIAENHSLDLMHDLFEGVGRDEIEYILTVFILKKKLFTLAELNNKIESFDYGSEKTNKPVPLTMETCKPCDREKLGTTTKVKAKQSAAEMACLIRYLGLILDDLIPTSKDYIDYWMLYVRLRQIVGIVTAPRFAIPDVQTVRNLIHQHHTLYQKLFGNMKPKHHMMIHIPRIMLENGPLVHFWAMTFERKHRDYKNIAKNVTCSKALPYTIALRNQLLLSCRKERSESSDTDFKLGPVKKNVDIEFRVVQHFENIESIESYKFVEILGNEFKNGTVFLEHIQNDEPKFAKVKDILKVDGNIYLHACSLPYIEFDYKYYAYHVQNNDVPDKFIAINDICYTPPGLLFTNKKLEYYVATKFDI